MSVFQVVLTNTIITKGEQNTKTEVNYRAAKFP